MSKKAFACLSLSAALLLCGMTGCSSKQEKPDFSGYPRIAELSVIECTAHNVAEIENDGTDMLFGFVNVGSKKAWFEYDGKVQLGIDVSKVSISDPDANNVVTITTPNAQVLGMPDVDENSFFDSGEKTGLFTQITAADKNAALQDAQKKMKEEIEGNQTLMAEARDRAKTLLKQYVIGVGEKLGTAYTVQFADAAE